jgi:hypothetical protein
LKSQFLAEKSDLLQDVVDCCGSSRTWEKDTTKKNITCVAPANTRISEPQALFAIIMFSPQSHVVSPDVFFGF